MESPPMKPGEIFLGFEKGDAALFVPLFVPEASGVTRAGTIRAFAQQR
jgi:hypothetical protein